MTYIMCFDAVQTIRHQNILEIYSKELLRNFDQYLCPVMVIEVLFYCTWYRTLIIRGNDYLLSTGGIL